jgi:Ca2+:H+ antiporter
MLSIIRSEAALIVGAATAVVMFTVGLEWLNNLADVWVFAGLFVWIFGVMIWSAFMVVRHADALADLLGEPFGTLILTISVISIEVSVIAAVMLSGDANPALARDTMLAVLMIVLNGMVGVALLVGGLRHGEQHFNLQGAQAFLGVLVTLATVTLILPTFTRSTDNPSLTPAQSALFAAVTIALYATFLAIQTSRHRGFFTQPDADEPSHGVSKPDLHGIVVRSVPYHAAFLLLTLLPIVLLSKKFASLVDHGTEQLGAPLALGGVVVAILVLAPEGLAAYHAAVANQMQRAVNICLGSAVATIGLTVPAVLIISVTTGMHIELGLEGTEIVMLALTLIVSHLTFSGTRTNMLQGAVHLVIFAVYFILIFNP